MYDNLLSIKISQVVILHRVSVEIDYGFPCDFLQPIIITDLL